MRRKTAISFFWCFGFLAILVLAEQVAGLAVSLATVLVLVASLLLVRKSCLLFTFKRLSVTSFWYLSYLAMIFVPSFVVYDYQEGLYRGRYLFAVETVLLTVPLGWSLANWLWSFNPTEIDTFYRRPVELGSVENGLLGRSWVLLIACLMLTVAYVIEVRTIPLLYLIRHPGDMMEVALLREESFKTLNSHLSYLYYWCRGTFYPFLILVSMGAYLETRTWKWLCTLLVASISGVLFAAFAVAKSPVALIVLVAAVFYYVYKQGHINRKTIAVMLILVFLFPVAVITYASSSESTTALLVMGAIGYRLFYIPAEVVYYYFEVFPHRIPYLHGRGIDKLAKLLNEPYFDTANMVGTYAYPFGLESVSANAAFISDLNADFGMWGVVLGGFIAGLIMQSMQIFVVRRRKTITTVALFSFLMVTFWFLNSTSLPVVLMSDGVILSVVLAWYLDRPKHAGLVAARAS